MPAALFTRLPIESAPARFGQTGERIQLDLIPETDLEEPPEAPQNSSPAVP